jgi:hypothetical protein
MTTDSAEEMAHHRRHLVAVLVDLREAVETILERTTALPHQVLNLESLASDCVSAAWTVRARILEAYAAVLMLEVELPLLSTDVDRRAARWPPSPADVIWRAMQHEHDASPEAS